MGVPPNEEIVAMETPHSPTRRRGTRPALLAAYAVCAALVMPAALWAADPPPAATTPTTATTAEPPPAAEPAPGPAAAAPEPEPAPEPARRKALQAAPAQTVSDDAAPVARAAASGGVSIQDFAFSPGTITVDVGDTVTWSNRDGVQHTATADDGSFDTGLLGRGQSGSHTFDEPGTFAYHCAPHPNMKATVVVRAASTGSSSGSGTPSGSSDPTSTPSAGAGSSGSTLPATGVQVALIALGGLGLVGAGALLRRRAED